MKHICLIFVFAMHMSAFCNEEVKNLKSKALKGDNNAAMQLGIWYRDGKKVKRDYKESMKWYRLAGDKGNYVAYDHMGWMYLRGYGVTKNVDIAVGYFEASAEKGHSQAMFNLGNIYANGIGGKKDLTKAFNYYHKAAKLNHSSAIMKTAAFLRDGKGIKKDISEAVNWYTKAEKKKMAGYYWPLGNLYYKGEGVKQNKEKAVKLWNKAREKGRMKFHATPLEVKILSKTKSEKGKFIFLKMGYLLQGHNMCAPTSSAMVLDYYGCKTDPYKIKKKCPNSPIGTGTGWDKLVIGIRSVSEKKWQTSEKPFTEEGFNEGFLEVKANLDKKFPVLIDVRGVEAKGGAHTVIACGYNEEKQLVYIQDPAIIYPGVKAVPYDYFKKMWNSQWYKAGVSGKVVRPYILTVWEK